MLKTLFASCQKSGEPFFWEVIDCFVLFAYACLVVWNLFAMITSLSELYSRLRRFILLVQMKKVIYITMTAVQAAETYEDELALT